MQKTPSTTQRTLLAVAVSMAAMSNQAFEFYSGELEGSFDSQLSVGSSWRMEEKSEFLISNTNNGNDGNSNFEKGDAFSQVFKGSHDLQLNYQNYGAFVRAKYWTDTALDGKEGDTPTATKDLGGNTVVSTVNQDFNSDNFNELSKTSGYALLDAFVYASFDAGDIPLDVRLGKQVVSWGESTFIGGGVNNINPYDVNEFTRPGATLKEGLLPVNMAYINAGLTDNLSAEVFYQLDFQETVLPGCGTYFATNDYAPDGCESAITSAGLLALNPNAFLSRRDAHKPDADGQFGVALRYVAESLGDTEFGLFYMNVHNRTPLVNGVKGANWVSAGDEFNGNIGDGTNGTYTPDAAGYGKAIGVALYKNTLGGNYEVVYPEDRQLAGVSFATNVGTMAVSGEITHKLEVPLQINATQIIGGGLTGDAGALASFGMTSTELLADILAVQNGDVFVGYREFDMTQVQMTVIKLFDQVGPMSRITVLGEAAYSFVHGLDDSSDDRILFDGNNADGGALEGGFYTQGAWGYRTLVKADFSDVFAGVNLSPVLTFSDDVKGYSANFKEGQQKLGISLKADYLSTYNAALSYTQYMGGKQSVVHDRDFASITMGMSF